jgi:hypothetical protein
LCRRYSNVAQSSAYSAVKSVSAIRRDKKAHQQEEFAL